MIVAYCANRAIYHLLPTALNSLLTNNPDVEKVYIFIEDDYIDVINHPAVEFINCNNYDFLIRKGLNCTKRFPYMAMVRCFFAKILKEDKVLYLDVDTIVDGNIRELWDFPLGGNYIAAREESGGYFNSGVLLMDLNLIRSTGAEDKIINLLKNCKFVFPDQDAMNIVFKNRIAYIPDYFNKLGRDKEAYETGKLVIRHFAGIVKPWKEKATEKDKALWMKYYAKAISADSEVR